MSLFSVLADIFVAIGGVITGAAILWATIWLVQLLRGLLGR